MASDFPEQIALEPPLKWTEQTVDPDSSGDQEDDLDKGHAVRKSVL
jgi:hypothetical protein